MKVNDIVTIKKLSSKSIAYYDRLRSKLDKSIVCPCHISIGQQMRITDILNKDFCLCLVLSDKMEMTVIAISDLENYFEIPRSSQSFL